MNRQIGFSLLEILVAFSILAISLGILLKIFSSGVNTALIAEEYTVATLIADSLMAKTGVEEPLVAGKTSGTEAEKYHWRINVENISNPASEEEGVVELMEVKVSVHWGGDEQNSRSIELTAVKVGSRL